ncbi:glycosyltransferase family 4 protein [Holzapfeliella sp. He02]|uniref:Glycosyltransferase family 4 protein n=1 Tax=Holzapfeliella saturejae TaxID=3082953 RepID=A0ABU8SH94_9LACO
MKILHINAGLENGGGLYHIIQLLKEAKAQNADFTLLTLADGPVAQAAREAGIKTETFSKSSRYQLSILKDLKNFINQGGYDIVHTHGARANLFLSMIHRQISAKWLVTVHSDPLKDFESHGIIGKVFTRLNCRSLKKADGILAVTNRFKEQLIHDIRLNPKKISTIYNGIAFTDNPLPKINHEGFNIVNVARLVPIKGHKLLLQAIKTANIPQLKLHLVGDGPLESELKQYVFENQLENQVEFHGYLKQVQINQLYQTADLAVLTSYSESFPLVMLEAADANVAILSTKVGDYQVMIPTEEYGFTAEIGSVESIASQLQAAYQKHVEQVLPSIAQRERTYLSTNFSIENQFNSIMKIYQQQLEGCKNDL